MFGSAEARALHARYPAIDLHADSLMWSRWTGYDIHARHEAPLPADGRERDHEEDDAQIDQSHRRKALPLPDRGRALMRPTGIREASEERTPRR